MWQVTETRFRTNKPLPHVTGPRIPVFSFVLDGKGEIPFFLKKCYCVFVGEAHIIVYMWRSGVNFVKFDFSTYLGLGPRGGTQTIRPRASIFTHWDSSASGHANQCFEGQEETSNFTTLTAKGRSKRVLEYLNFYQDSSSSSEYGSYPDAQVPRGKNQMEIVTSRVLALKATYVSALVRSAVTVACIQGVEIKVHILMRGMRDSQDLGAIKVVAVLWGEEGVVWLFVWLILWKMQSTRRALTLFCFIFEIII